MVQYRRYVPIRPSNWIHHSAFIVTSRVPPDAVNVAHLASLTRLANYVPSLLVSSCAADVIVLRRPKLN